MPILVQCDELQAGMRLAEAFLHRGRMMLPGGKALTGDDIDVLRRKYPEVTLKVGDPVLDSLVAFEDDSREREIAHEVTQKISAVMGEVQQKFSARANLSGLDFNGVHRTVSGVVEYLKENPVSAALLTRGASDRDYLAEHAGNVFYLSMVLGSAVRDYVVRERQRQTSASQLSHSVAMNLLPLGLGAMFLDIGMAGLQHIFAPEYELTGEDRARIFAHPTVGADMLPESMPAVARLVVRSHHENFDGSGYPDRKPGERLHVFVRIARICDAFDAATSDKLYRKAKSAVRVLWEMAAGPYRKCYDPVLMKVFTGVIQPFPIGAKLKLADGRTAVVVKYNRRMPFQPTVVVAFDEKGERVPVDRLVGPVNVGEGNDLKLATYGEEDLGYMQDVVAPVEGLTFSAEAFRELTDAAYP
jgi:HD-GYP domain-containing protein (c-di-GMP phosphodiesterase class II)